MHEGSPTTEVWNRWEGQLVDGKFPLQSCLGSSDHSGVFLTEHSEHPRAALKLIPAIPTRADWQFACWNAAASHPHRHLIRLLHTGQCRLGDLDYLYVVMEYADQNLAQLLAQRALTEEEARELLPPCLEALGFLHRSKLVQGQLKPSNILVVGDQLKLASDTIRPTAEAIASIGGPSLYDPPEARDGRLWTAGDVWGLGVMLTEALTRARPSLPDKRGEPPVPPPELSAAFADFVRQCLSYDPTARPSVADLETWLQRGVEGPTTSVPADHDIPAVRDASSGQAPDQPMILLEESEIRGSGAPARREALDVMSGLSATREALGSPALGRAAVREALDSPVSGRAATRETPDVMPSRTSTREGLDGGATGRAAMRAAIDAGVFVRAGVQNALDVIRHRPLVLSIAASVAVVLVSWASLRVFIRAKHNSPTPAAASQASLQPAAAAPDAVTTAPEAPSPLPGSTQPSQTATLATNTDTADAMPTAAASVVHQEIPKVPRSARRTIHGHVKVVVRVTVNKSGLVVHEVLADHGPSRYFARLAIKAARKWKFAQGEDQTSRQWLVGFVFSRDGTKGHAVALRS